MGIEFHETRMGHKFYDSDVPRLVTHLGDISESLRVLVGTKPVDTELKKQVAQLEDELNEAKKQLLELRNVVQELRITDLTGVDDTAKAAMLHVFIDLAKKCRAPLVGI